MIQGGFSARMEHEEKLSELLLLFIVLMDRVMKNTEDYNSIWEIFGKLENVEFA